MFAPVYGSYSNIAGKQEEIEMFDKLEDLLIRLEEILSELQEPDVASDPNRFRKLMKEQSELTPIVEAYKEYKACKQNIEESLELLNEESDEDMRELAKEELNESKASIRFPLKFSIIVKGVPEYTLTDPTFDRITIRLNPEFYGKDKLVIEKKENGSPEGYIQKIELGGKKTGYRINHNDLVKGGTLTFYK